VDTNAVVVSSGNDTPPDILTGQLPETGEATAEPTVEVDKEGMDTTERNVVGTLLTLATVLLMAHLIAIWPAVISATATKPRSATTTLLFGLVQTTFTPDVVLIAMVLIVGSLGAFVATMRRFMTYARQDELTRRDAWSYLMRPMQGAALALIVYFTLRGGYLGQAQAARVNPYGIATLAALVGLFTRHAIDRLTAVFDTLFGKPQEDAHPAKVRPEKKKDPTDSDARRPQVHTNSGSP
jgi:hypothetical protein